MADIKKIMIIGAGAGQVPIIRAAKRRGLLTVVVSPYGPYPGIDEADVLIPIDIFDKSAVLEAAKREKIDYVISDQSDFAVPTVAFVAENLGLAGNSIATADIYSNKGIQRRFCQENGLPVPSAVTVTCESDLGRIDFDFPWVVKPTDSQGSRGVKKINNLDQATEALREALQFSKQGFAIVEEFFEGREVVCEGFVVEGEYYNVAFADREYFNLPDKFIPSKTIFPSTINDDIKQKLLENDALFTEKAGAKFGIIHSEYLVNSRGDFRLVETALRGGGVYISSHLIPQSIGIDLTELLLDYLLIGPNEAKLRLSAPRQKADKSSAYVCFYLEEGIVREVQEIEKIKNDESVLIAEVDKVVPGFMYNGLKHKGDRLGPFVIAGKNRKDVFEKIEWVKRSYKVFMNASDNVSVFWG